jgi:acyl carrier protein
MEEYPYEKLREIVLDIIGEAITKFGRERNAIDEDQNLLKVGYLDSFAFINAIMELEARTGVTIDLSEINSDEFSTVSGMIKGVVSAQRRGPESRA